MKSSLLIFPVVRYAFIVPNVIMEELAELSKEVAKAYRDKVDYFNLLQEMGDVLICLDSLQDIFGISDEDLQKAKNVKLARNMQRVKDNGTFD